MWAQVSFPSPVHSFIAPCVRSHSTHLIGFDFGSTRGSWKQPFFLKVTSKTHFTTLLFPIKTWVAKPVILGNTFNPVTQFMNGQVALIAVNQGVDICSIGNVAYTTPLVHRHLLRTNHVWEVLFKIQKYLALAFFFFVGHGVNVTNWAARIGHVCHIWNCSLILSESNLYQYRFGKN